MNNFKTLVLVWVIMINASVYPLHMTPGFELIGRARCSYYFKSIKNSNWFGARDGCRNELDRNATLVNLESHEERDRLKQMLDDDYDGAATFWVGGGWGQVSEKSCYMWFALKQCVDEESVIVWDENQGRIFGNSKRYLQIIYKGIQETMLFRAARPNNNARYLCELPIKSDNCNAF